MIRWLCLALLTGCGGDSTPAPVVGDAARTAVTLLSLEERRARYESRATVEPPVELPELWRDLPRRMEARLGRVEHEVRTRWGKGEPYRRIQMELRVFGSDAGVEARLLSALGALGLPGLETGLPTATVTVGDVTWSVGVRRFVAPPGQAREAIISLEWRRVPVDPPEPQRCKKPPSVKAPKGTPKWMRARTLRMTTRHRVAATVARDPDGVRISMLILFRNGETQTGDLTRLVALAKRLRLTLDHEDGMTQRWAGRKNIVEWRARTGDLNLGCTLTGPVLELTWTRRKT